MTDKQIEAQIEYMSGECDSYNEGYKNGFSYGVRYHRDNQWVKTSLFIPEEDEFDKGYSKRVLGLFNDGSFCKCFCSIEEKIWFIDGIVCDEPVLWTYLPKQ